MKKIKLLLLASLIAGSASAQYFQHVYGSPRNEFLESGINGNLLFKRGHIMTGYTDLTGRHDLMVTSTDFDGRFVTLPVFNNRFTVSENNVVVDARGRSVIQPTAFGGRIGVWGDFAPTPTALSTKFFYALIQPNGGGGTIWSYALNIPIVEAEATAMTASSSNPGTIFMCGFVRVVAGGPRNPIVMSINGATGVVNWALMYQIGGVDWTAMDLIESPYLSTTGNTDVAITGHFNVPGSAETGCFFLVDATNGLNTSTVVEYGTPFSVNPCALNAIDIANNPIGSGRGFVMGGYGNNPGTGNDDSWAIKVSPNGTIVDFSMFIDYSNPGNNNYGNDIIERLNLTGTYEYYLGGYVANGIFGGEDEVVFKLDFFGNPVPRGQFTFGGPGNERAMQLDQFNGVAPTIDGLSTFGSTNGSFPSINGSNFYLVKTYFNGVTRCAFDLQDPFRAAGPVVLGSWNPTIPNRLFQRNLTMVRASMLDVEICWEPNDANGDNTRMAAVTTDALMQPGYFPNPVSRDNAIVTVTFGNKAVDGVAEIELWNSLGQLCWTKKVPVTDGQTNMQVELGNELSGGMYHLIVRQNGALNNYRILVQ